MEQSNGLSSKILFFIMLGIHFSAFAGLFSYDASKSQSAKLEARNRENPMTISELEVVFAKPEFDEKDFRTKGIVDTWNLLLPGMQNATAPALANYGIVGHAVSPSALQPGHPVPKQYRYVLTVVLGGAVYHTQTTAVDIFATYKLFDTSAGNKLVWIGGGKFGETKFKDLFDGTSYDERAKRQVDVIIKRMITGGIVRDAPTQEIPKLANSKEPVRNADLTTAQAEKSSENSTEHQGDFISATKECAVLTEPNYPYEFHDSGWAKLDDSAKFPDNTALKREAIDHFNKMPSQRALAITASGHWQTWQASQANPRAPQKVLALCVQKFNEPCYLYAVDENVVFPKDAGTGLCWGKNP